MRIQIKLYQTILKALNQFQLFLSVLYRITNTLSVKTILFSLFKSFNSVTSMSAQHVFFEIIFHFQFSLERISRKMTIFKGHQTMLITKKILCLRIFEYTLQWKTSYKYNNLNRNLNTRSYPLCQKPGIQLPCIILAIYQQSTF